MNENEIQAKNNAVIHKDNSLNRLDLSFIKHIELIRLVDCKFGKGII